MLRVERSYFRGHVTPPKSSYGRRRIRLSEELARGLWEHRKQTQGRDGDLVFRSSTGSWLHAGHLADNVFRPAVSAAKVPWLGFHGFRHTCATALFREGRSIKQVQAALGHHSPAFTLETYVHLLPQDLPEPPSIGVAALAGGRAWRPAGDPLATLSPLDGPKAASGASSN